MAMEWRKCAFAGCGCEFQTERTLKATHGRYCSRECKDSEQILGWAQELQRLQRENLPRAAIAQQMGIEPQQVTLRSKRLRTYCERYPLLAQALAASS